MWPGKLNQVTCKTHTTRPVLSNVSKSKFLFIEFPPGLMKDINVFELIEITGAHYKLRGVVQCKNNHFTCAVENHNKWTYFDDLCFSVKEFAITLYCEKFLRVN